MMYARNQRAETRNRAKDELKRVINSLDKVRKWYEFFYFEIYMKFHCNSINIIINYLLKC